LIPIDVDPSLVADIAAIEQITYQRPPTIIRPEIKPPIQTTSGGVDRVETYTIVPAILSSKSDFEGVLLKGYESDYQFERIKSYMKRGSWVSYPADGPAQEIVLSEQISNRMNFDVGDKMIIYFILDGEQYKKRFTVSGIYKTGLEEYDRRFALVDTRVLQEVLSMLMISMMPCCSMSISTSRSYLVIYIVNLFNPSFTRSSNGWNCRTLMSMCSYYS